MPKLCVPLLIAALPLLAQTGTEKGEWRYYGGDERGTRYAPLDQINEQNVSRLQVAWRWKSTNFGPTPQATSQMTPLMVNGVLYFATGPTRTVIAADAATGETLWTYRLQEQGRGEGPLPQRNRGVAYWTDGRGDERIIVISPGYQLFTLDAKIGRRIDTFGTNGLTDLWIGLDRDGRVKPGTIGATSPAIVVRDVIVVGMAAIGSQMTLPTLDNTPGYIRGYDVRSGRLLWTFHTIPRPGEAGIETWGADSWKFASNTGAWGPLAADDELGEPSPEVR